MSDLLAHSIAARGDDYTVCVPLVAPERVKLPLMFRCRVTNETELDALTSRLVAMGVASQLKPGTSIYVLQDRPAIRDFSKSLLHLKACNVEPTESATLVEWNVIFDECSEFLWNGTKLYPYVLGNVDGESYVLPHPDLQAGPGLSINTYADPRDVNATFWWPTDELRAAIIADPLPITDKVSVCRVVSKGSGILYWFMIDEASDLQEGPIQYHLDNEWESSDLNVFVGNSTDHEQQMLRVPLPPNVVLCSVSGKLTDWTPIYLRS